MIDQLGGAPVVAYETPAEFAADPAPAAFGAGLYDRAHTEATYAELLRRAGALLGRGESVVLDASWSDVRQRRAAVDLADRTHTRVVALMCQAPAAVPTHGSLGASLERAGQVWRDATGRAGDRRTPRCGSTGRGRRREVP